MGRSRYRFIAPAPPRFITCALSHWMPVSIRPETVPILLDSLRYLSENDQLEVYALCIPTGDRGNEEKAPILPQAQTVCQCLPAKPCFYIVS